MIVLFSFMVAYLTVMVVSYWANKFSPGISGKWMLIIGIISFVVALLFQLFAPETLIFLVSLVGFGILMLTLFVFWISGNK